MERKMTLEHQWLEVMYQRGGLDGKDTNRLKNLENGFVGECAFDQFVTEFGGRRWRVYRDVWIDCGGPTQIDTMIVTNSGIYICDVKNYSGEYSYAGGQWYVNGRSVIKDIFVQLKRSMEKIRMMQHRIGGQFTAEGIIVFINEHFMLELETEVSEKVVCRNQLRKYLHEIDQESAFGRVSVEKLCSEIEKYIIDCPYLPPICDEDSFHRLIKGIRCEKCGSFNVDVDRTSVRCGDCQIKMGKEKVVLRSICEYGVVMHHKALKLQELYEFMGGKVEKRYIRSILIRHFEMLSIGKHAKYKNPREKFLYLFGNYNFRYKDKTGC